MIWGGFISAPFYMPLKLVIALSLTLASCGGRNASPVLTYQTSDAQLTCQEIHDEDRNLKNLTLGLQEEDYRRNERNLMIAYLGPFLVFVPYFFLDFSNATHEESEAAFHRSRHLAKLRNSMGCPSTAQTKAR